MPFGKIEKKLSLKEQIYLNIKISIIKGKLRAEDFLVETEMAKTMNISRAPIREALMKLEQEGFVMKVSRKGYQVASITKKEICELYEMRLVLEPFAVKISIDSIPLDEINEVEALIEKLIDKKSDLELFIETDRQLHKLLYSYVSNDYMRNTIETIEEHSLRTRYAESYGGVNENKILNASMEHLKILKALKERNAAYAVETVCEHIVNGKERTLSSLDK